VPERRSLDVSYYPVSVYGLSMLSPVQRYHSWLNSRPGGVWFGVYLSFLVALVVWTLAFYLIFE